MNTEPSPVAALLAAFHGRTADPIAEARERLGRVNRNANRNTYLALDAPWTLAESERQVARADFGEKALPLFGLPVSLKDCFDISGMITSSGSKFYALHKQIASSDSWVAARLRRAGAVIVGKTHLHQIAYGITGENPDYGDCLQPADSALLTGGSSSGAAASIQEGSAVAAIGTDTGGSIRVPAALCGLAGFRSSLGLGGWAGGGHLAPTFDTIGWLFRDLRDSPLLAEALFDLPDTQPAPIRSVGVLSGCAIEECDASVLQSMRWWQEQLESAGLQVSAVDPTCWRAAWDIYAPIQAAEAAHIHAGHFREFDPFIAERLAWGASISPDELQRWRARHRAWCEQFNMLFREHDFLLAPATPISRLPAGLNHASSRASMLRQTAPASLAGVPAVVLPSPDCGLQLIARRNDDRRLLRFAAVLGERICANQNL